MLWLKAQSEGYGRFGVRAGLTEYAHRLSYVIAYGEIPDGLVIDHVRDRGCTNTMCVAPLHLEAVTNAENVRRGDAGLHMKDMTHCRNGHPFAGKNLYTKPSGERRCRTCTRAAERARYRRERAA